MKISEKTKISKKQLFAAIALVLALAFAASFVTALPIAFGQTGGKFTSGSSIAKRPDPVGVNQVMQLESVIYPYPDAGVYSGVTWTITRPDKTKDIMTMTTDSLGVIRLDYTCTQTGTWSLAQSWPGDATHTATSTSSSWTVQTDAVTLPGKITTYAFIGTVPKDIVGLGDYIYVVGWVSPPSELNGAVWDNYKFTITKPDGTTDILTKISDSPETSSFGYLCDQAGTWTVQLSWPGDPTHLGSDSNIATWVVEAGYTNPTYPSQPLPTGSWKFPISAEYRDWYQISGSWPMTWYSAAGVNFDPYTKGPATAHILWSIPLVAGGIVGETGFIGLSGTQYSGLPIYTGNGEVAADGRIYYTRTQGYGAQQQPDIVCLNQYTGEKIWEQLLYCATGYPGSGSSLAIEIMTRGKIDPKTGDSGTGAFSLWVMGGGIWELEPLTGNVRYYWAGGPSGTYDDGYMYFNGYNGTLGASQSGTVTKWDTRSKATVWTAPIRSVTFISDGIIISVSQSTGAFTISNQMITYSATDGSLIANGPDLGIYSAEGTSRNCAADGMYFLHGIDMKVHAISLQTATEVWTSEPWRAPWGDFAMYSESAAYGNVYFKGWDGYVYCYNDQTGAKQWEFFCGNSTETAMGNLVAWGQMAIGGGKLYFSTSEHTPPSPLPRGNKMFCLDAFTGEELWTYPICWAQNGAGISAGMVFAPDMYTGGLFCFGMGETATTVSAPTTAVPLGSSVLIQGTVTDQSSGAKGTPAVSDASMGPWMEYLYDNKPMPADATGVPVHLVAIDSACNVIDIGHATSDSSGHYGYIWTPPAQETYAIVASFDGSNAYYSSYGETYVGVTAAPPPTPTPQANIATTDMVAQTNMYLIGATIAIIIVVIAATILILRKRK